MAAAFSIGSFFGRLAMAIVLVFSTYNPSEYSWVHWFISLESKTEPFLLLSGIALLIGWVIFLGATVKSLGLVGMILGTALLGAVLWVFIFYGWLSLENSSAIAWVVLTMSTILLAIGVSWSHIRRRLTGQLDVDDIDES